MLGDVRRVPTSGVFLALFLIGAETFLVSPLLPVMAADLEVAPTQAAASVTAYVVTYACISPFLGALSDRIGRRTPLIAGLTLFLVANLICAVGTSLTLVIVGRAVGGLGAALAGPSVWAYLADSVPEDQVGRIMGRGMAFFSGGQVIGIPVGAAVSAVAGWRWSFAVLAVGSLCAVVFLARQVPADGNARTHTSWLSSFSVVGDLRITVTLAATLVTQLFSLGAYAYVGEVLHSQFHWGQTTLGLVGVLVGVGSVIGSLVNGRLISVHRGGSWRRLGWVTAMGGAVVIFAVVPSPVVAVVALAVWFIGSGAFVTEQQAVLAASAGGRRAAASAWNTSAMHAGTALGVTVIGLAPVITTGIWTVAVAGVVAATVLTVVGTVLPASRTREVAPV